MMRSLKYICLLITAVSLTSCLMKNDMSYPIIKAEILEFAVEEQLSATIDNATRTVSVVLSETADPKAQKLTAFRYTEDAKSSGLPEVLDLTAPVKLTLSIYQDYEWTIVATQPIERYVRCSNQVGDAEFNLKEKQVLVYVNAAQDLASVEFTDMKLEPESSEILTTTGMTPKNDGSGEVEEKTEEVYFPLSLNCVMQRTFKVVDRGVESVWTLTVEQKSVDLEIKGVAWCYHADVIATYSQSAAPVLQYKKLSDKNWTDVADLSVEGINITASIGGLRAGTDYVAKLVEGEREAVWEFKTGKPQQLPNMSFDDWTCDNPTSDKIVWYPDLNKENPIWDTANGGAAKFIGSLTSRTPSLAEVEADQKGFVISGNAVRMESKDAVIAFAAGNIYTGKFGKISGLSGAELDWGTPFTGRPRALKGYYAYSPKKIDNDKYVKPPFEHLKNTMDKCQILAILTDWDAPFHVNTNIGQFVDIENDPGIIACGVLESDEDTRGEYREFTLELEYRRPFDTPKYVVVVACSSYRGNFFTGALGSVMYVDQFEFLYD